MNTVRHVVKISMQKLEITQMKVVKQIKLEFKHANTEC